LSEDDDDVVDFLVFPIKNHLAITFRIRLLAVMVKYTTDVKKLFHKGIIRAKEEGILPETFRKRVIPIIKVYLYLFIMIL